CAWRSQGGSPKFLYGPCRNSNTPGAYSLKNLRAHDEDLVDKPELDGSFRGQERVPLERVFDLLDGTTRVFRVDRVEPLLQIEDFLRMQNDVGCVAFKAVGRLVQHDARVRQGETHTLSAGSEQP